MKFSDICHARDRLQKYSIVYDFEVVLALWINETQPSWLYRRDMKQIENVRRNYKISGASIIIHLAIKYHKDI